MGREGSVPLDSLYRYTWFGNPGDGRKSCVYTTRMRMLRRVENSGRLTNPYVTSVKNRSPVGRWYATSLRLLNCLPKKLLRMTGQGGISKGRARVGAAYRSSCRVLLGW